MSFQQNHWLQKLTQFKKLQKTYPLHYTILKTLTQSIQQQQKLPFHQLYQSTLKSLPQQIKHLTLCKSLIHSIWINDNYPIKVRQQCCPQILKLITQWIVEFEIRADQVKVVGDKFSLIKQFILGNCKSVEMMLLIVDQIFQDLRDLFDESFWNLPEENVNTQNKEYTFVVEVDEEAPRQLIDLLQLIIYRQLQSLSSSSLPKQQQQITEFYLSTSKSFASQNYNTFVLKLLNYLLCLQLTQSQQSQATKLALQFIRSIYCIQNQQQTIKLFKRLMLRTKKPVRYALVEEYIETYKFFQFLHCDHVIEQLEDMVYFRELIVGHSKVETAISSKALQDNLPLLYFTQLIVKAGSKERIYFAVQDCPRAILKLQLILQQNMDINLKIYHLNTGTKEVLYHEENKTQLRKLDLKINYMGLYAIQFDNVYSWIHSKKILYNLHILRKVDNMQEIINEGKM